MPLETKEIWDTENNMALETKQEDSGRIKTKREKEKIYSWTQLIYSLAIIKEMANILSLFLLNLTVSSKTRWRHDTERTTIAQPVLTI